ncbi:MAG: hypothetical protein R3E21_03650 [Caenibius sp.]
MKDRAIYGWGFHAPPPGFHGKHGQFAHVTSEDKEDLRLRECIDRDIGSGILIARGALIGGNLSQWQIRCQFAFKTREGCFSIMQMNFVDASSSMVPDGDQWANGLAEAGTSPNHPTLRPLKFLQAARGRTREGKMTGNGPLADCPQISLECRNPTLMHLE